MTINEHKLIHTEDAGNGYHGYCKLPLVTDLGYCSWDNTTCVDREVVNYLDIPKKVREYAKFHGLVFNNNDKTFVKPYYNEVFSIDQLISKMP